MSKKFYVNLWKEIKLKAEWPDRDIEEIKLYFFGDISENDQSIL